MKRSTHLVMGIAAAVPVAAALPPVGAFGCLWFGMTGGAIPDYLDLRSEARRALRHRGASHGLIVLALATVFFWYVLGALQRAEYQLFPVPARYVTPWSLAFGLGMISHLLGDACTRGGIQPLLPIAGWKLWLLPRFLRGRSDGRINGLARLLSCAVIGLGLAVYLVR